MTKRSIDPIVSADWLEEHLGAEGSAVIDLRATEDYEAGHIPGAISVPFVLVSAWSDCTEELILELPPAESLMKTIGDCGLTSASQVVLVGRLPVSPEPPYPLADPVRVAATLIYAGVKNAAVLDGGHAKWVAEGKLVSLEVPRTTPVPYQSAVDSQTWVSTEYVKERIGKAVLVDARDPDVYFGVSMEPFADMEGHIPTARSLPMVWVWEPDGTYKPLDVIRQMAEGVIGPDKDQEIICYCKISLRGYEAAGLPEANGWVNVKVLEWGIMAWPFARER